MRPILSRHRLRQPYRAVIVGLWILPVPLLLLAILIGNGVSLVLLDPRLWLPLAVMLLPAFYVWQEGVDAHPEGITARVFVPSYHAYDDLTHWHMDDRPEGHILTVWDRDRRKVISLHAAHLTDLPLLLNWLEAHVDPPQRG